MSWLLPTVFSLLVPLTMLVAACITAKRCGRCCRGRDNDVTEARVDSGGISTAPSAPNGFTISNQFFRVVLVTPSDFRR